jgi:hypothetical protein
MEKMYKYGFFIALIAIVVLLLMPRNCSGPQGIVSSIDTFYTPSNDSQHSIALTSTVAVPIPYKVEVPIKGDTIWMPPLKTKVDTLAILADYYLRRTYNDSITNDSITIYLKESVCKNQLKRDSVRYRWKAPNMTIKEVVLKEKQLLYLGVEPNVNLKDLNFGMYLSADLDIERALLGIGYDPYHKSYKFSVKAKLQLWNKRSKK